MRPKRYLPLRLPPPLEYTQIVRTPALEKIVRLNDSETALIYSRPPLCGHDRFFYTVERKTEDGGIQMSNSYDRFYSVEEAEQDARYFTGISIKLPAEQPANLHRHICFTCEGLPHYECVNPDCSPSYYERLPVECPRCGALTLQRRRPGRRYKGSVSTLISPAKAQAVAAD